jgi:regulator of protease activity HflC (stomatin/prohibitin superfamily)
LEAGPVEPIVLAALVLLVLAPSIRIVPQGHACAVERLGRYHRTLGPGLAVLIPLLERPRKPVDLREQAVALDRLAVPAGDGLVASVDVAVGFRVMDAKSATYAVVDYVEALEQLAEAALRRALGGLTLEVALASRDELGRQLGRVLGEATRAFGVRVDRVELTALDPPHGLPRRAAAP